MFHYKILEKIQDDDWNKCLQSSSYANFFQTAEYLKYESSSSNRFPIFIKILNDKNEVKGQLGLIVHQSVNAYSSLSLKKISGLISKIGNRASWVSGPIIYSNESSEQLRVLNSILEAIEWICKKYNILIIDGYTPPLDKKINQEYLSEFQKNDFQVQNFITLVTDLSQSYDLIWSKLKKNAQRDVSRAEKREVYVKELSKEDLDAYFEIKGSWAKTKGISINKISEQSKKSYWDYYKRGIEKVFLAFEDAELVASHRLGCLNGIMYSHKITNSYKKKVTVGGSYLTWYALMWAKKNGLKFYDYSGGEAPPINSKKIDEYEKKWGSLMSYKKKWGGEELPYYHLTKVVKKRIYQFTRGFSKIDWKIRNYKKEQYTKNK